MTPKRSGPILSIATLHDLSHQVWAWSAVALAAVVFSIDTFTSLQTAVAVFYVIVIHLAASMSRRDYLIIASTCCTALTIISYVVVHGSEAPGASLIRCIVSLSAIFITTTLAFRNSSIEEMLSEQANLLELTHDAVFARDMSSTITYWNRGAEELYGWHRDEAIGRNSDELLRTQFPTTPEFIREALLEQGRWEGELVHTTRDGLQVVTATRWALQRDKGNAPVAVLEANTDITARTRAQEALHKAQSELAHASRVATLGELSASIAHEVNQPLAAIATNGEAALRWLAREQPDLSEARDALKRVVEDSRRASAVIRRLQMLSRKGDQQRVALDLNEIVSESLVLMEQEISSRGIALQLDLEKNLPPVGADRIQMQQVLMNLVINAAQAMETVPRDRRCLRIDTMTGDTHVCLLVTDSGVGFDEEAGKNLFNAFYTTKDSGMGLGLSICRSIVDSHGGLIRATRAEGSGATFHVSLPRAGDA